MSKQVFELTAKRVVYETSLPASEVAKRLDASVGALESGIPVTRFFNDARTRAEVENAVGLITGPDKDFMCARNDHFVVVLSG